MYEKQSSTLMYKVRLVSCKVVSGLRGVRRRSGGDDSPSAIMIAGSQVLQKDLDSVPIIDPNANGVKLGTEARTAKRHIAHNIIYDPAQPIYA